MEDVLQKNAKKEIPGSYKAGYALFIIFLFVLVFYGVVSSQSMGNDKSANYLLTQFLKDNKALNISMLVGVLSPWLIRFIDTVINRVFFSDFQITNPNRLAAKIPRVMGVSASAYIAWAILAVEGVISINSWIFLIATFMAIVAELQFFYLKKYYYAQKQQNG